MLRFARNDIIILLLLTACQPGLTPVARSTPAVLTVQSTPALQSLAETYRACTRELGSTGLVLQDTPASALDPARADVALRWGPTNTVKYYAVVVAEEELAIVVHPQNPLKSIHLADLQNMYKGIQQDWPPPVGDSSPATAIQPWVYLPGDDAQSVFESAILKGQPASARVVHLAPDPAAMRDAIAVNPAAVGFLPRRWLNASVKELPVEGAEPGSLRQPILALTRSEPGGLEKSWLICLEERIPH